MSNFDAYVDWFNETNRENGLEVTSICNGKGEVVAFFARYPRTAAAKAYKNAADYAERYCAWQNFVAFVGTCSHGAIRISTEKTAFEHGIINFDVNPKDDAYNPDAVKNVLDQLSRALTNGFGA